MRKIILVTFLFLLTPIFVIGQEVEQINAGLVSDVWYSESPFFAGENVKIYSAIWNQSGFDVIGKINFLDNGEVIGESVFSIRHGELLDKSIDWEVFEGEHKIKTEIFNARKVSTNGEEKVSLVVNTSNENIQFADLDTDGDRVGNLEDDDDDNDGITDSDEKINGTDPLVFNKNTNETKVLNVSDSNDGLTNKSKIEEGREVAEKFVIEPAKEITEKALLESKPVIKRIEDLLKEKSLVLDEKIKQDKEEVIFKEEGDEPSFYEKLGQKLPPVFRILYSWLLKILILFFSIWWLPLVVFVLIVLRFLIGLWRRFRR